MKSQRVGRFGCLQRTFSVRIYRIREREVPGRFYRDFNGSLVLLEAPVSPLELFQRSPTCKNRTPKDLQFREALSFYRPAAQDIAHIINHDVTKSRNKREIGDNAPVWKTYPDRRSPAGLDFRLSPFLGYALRTQACMVKVGDGKAQSLIRCVRQRSRIRHSVGDLQPN